MRFSSQQQALGLGWGSSVSWLYRSSENGMQSFPCCCTSDFYYLVSLSVLWWGRVVCMCVRSVLVVREVIGTAESVEDAENCLVGLISSVRMFMA